MFSYFSRRDLFLVAASAAPETSTCLNVLAERGLFITPTGGLIRGIRVSVSPTTFSAA